MPIPNICVGVCKLHPLLKICIGCYRSRLELNRWHKAEDDEKEEIVQSCQQKKEIYGELSQNNINNGKITVETRFTPQ